MGWNTRTIGTMGTAVLISSGAWACASNGSGGPADDSRLGEMGNVRFGGGGGCNSSTVMALESTAEMVLEPQPDVELPDDLTVRSTDPLVIEASPGDSPEEIVLEARGNGEATIELVSQGEVWDRLVFGTDRATSLTYTSADLVFAGATHFVQIDEIYGTCGDDSCPLIGGELLVWSSAPDTALPLSSDVARVALFVAGVPGEATIFGHEPIGGAGLLEHAVEIVPVGSAGDLEARVVVMLPDETVLDPQTAPVEMPVGSLFQVRFYALSSTREVAISRFDMDWTVTGDPGVLEEQPLQGNASPDGPIWAVLEAGSASIEGTCTVISRSTTVDVLAP